MIAQGIVMTLSVIGSLSVICFVFWFYAKIREEKDHEKRRMMDFYDSTKRNMDEIITELQNMQRIIK